MSTKADILRRIDELIAHCGRAGDRDPLNILNGTLTLMRSLYGPDSLHVRALLQRRNDIYEDRTWAEHVRHHRMVQALQGALANLREEVEQHLLVSLERRITGDVLSDLLQLARAALSEPGDAAKNVAAVLAAAAFEDTLRRIAREHGGSLGDKLADVVDSLKSAAILVPPQLGIALSYLNFRNRALHADWDNIDRVSVESVLAFVEQLLLKHFSTS